MLAASKSTNDSRIISESEPGIVDRAMMKDDVSDGCDQIPGASGTQCGLNGFHHISPHGFQLVSRIGLLSTFHMQPLAPNRKCGKLPSFWTVCKARMSEIAAGDAARKDINSWRQKHSGYAVITGRFSILLQMCLTLTFFGSHVPPGTFPRYWRALFDSCFDKRYLVSARWQRRN